MKKSFGSTIAFALLAAMFALLFFSQWNESAIMDELAHIPAGYSYLTQQDMRLNPEHPPLAKDLAAFPLLFLRLNFPLDIPSWATDVNGQWTAGAIFLYEAGNNPDQIVRWARFPMMLLTIFFGWLFFQWVRRRYGERVGLLSLFFFTTSPTILAHGRYVTTDLAAAFGFFIGVAALLFYLKRPGGRRLALSGLILGVALLLKFSLFLLLPLWLLLGLLWVYVNEYDALRGLSRARAALHYARAAGRMIAALFLMSFIATLVIMLVYLFHVWRYPVERQATDAAAMLSSFGNRTLVNMVVGMAGIPVVRAFGQYLTGLLMFFQPPAPPNTPYFLGEVSAAGWRSYFPVLYLLKESLAFHALTLIALAFGIYHMTRRRKPVAGALVEWLRENFMLTASIVFIAVYWIFSIRSPLNIGVRHILPTLPFVYLLVARQIVRWLHIHQLVRPETFLGLLRYLYHRLLTVARRASALTVLLSWMALAVLLTFPNFLSYYNALAGGSEEGYRIAADSNYDWGQDLRRLGQFLEKENISRIALDYFGGGSPTHELGERYVQWRSADGLPQEPYFAISATLLQNARGKPVKGFEIRPEDRYAWLEGKTPVARAGASIFIYQFE